MKSEQTLAVYFRDVLGLPNDATMWLVDLFVVIQRLDDIVDEDKFNREHKYDLILRMMVYMQTNMFYINNLAALNSVISLAILKWKASDYAEINKLHDERSFIWRASYYDVVLKVVELVHGIDKAMDLSQAVMFLYGEKYQEYLKEFK